MKYSCIFYARPFGHCIRAIHRKIEFCCMWQIAGVRTWSARASAPSMCLCICTVYVGIYDSIERVYPGRTEHKMSANTHIHTAEIIYFGARAKCVFHFDVISAGVFFLFLFVFSLASPSARQLNKIAFCISTWPVENQNHIGNFKSFRWQQQRRRRRRGRPRPHSPNEPV